MALLLFSCFLTSLSLAHGASTIHISPSQPPTGLENTIWENSTKKFIVAETPLYGPTYNNPQVIGDASVALAAQRTFRKDPVNGFQKYTGGWNISNHHYWASVGYTAGPLFAVAAAWFLGFGICLLVICMCHICHRTKSIGYSRVAYILSLIFLLVFTLMAILSCFLSQNWMCYAILGSDKPCDSWMDFGDWYIHLERNVPSATQLINTVVSNVSNINFSPVFAQMYYNQSGPLLPLLCNPFNHDLTDRPCSPGELDLNNATQAWSTFVCQVNTNGTCITTGRLTPALYGQMASCVNISTGLINDAPFLVQLQDCSYAKQTFRDITNNNCPGLRRSGYRVYVGLAILSTAVMLSLLFWIIYSRERRHRKEALPEYSESKEIVRVNF
ncbi:unnamed protein product [Eruca vesicaria subsp. sativa]|uniref:Uncharacterized protein n=1 Tax=Eruca vesicaria subsp. sativa TaxID=29727 RepID=A0ABC8LLR5_ERUVS|nr:unnamed protein product [Eruca vesicaria subsp. sativa]